LIGILGDRDLQLKLAVPLNWLVPGDLRIVHVAETGLDYNAAITPTLGRVETVSRMLKVYGAIRSEIDRLLPGISGSTIFLQH
jgi:hypothetical protein